MVTSIDDVLVEFNPKEGINLLQEWHDSGGCNYSPPSHGENLIYNIPMKQVLEIMEAFVKNKKYKKVLK